MKFLNLTSTRIPVVQKVKKTMLLVLSASLIFAACKKGAEDESAAGVEASAKTGASVSAVGRPIITVFPVRAPHNTGWDSATGGSAPSSFNCGSTHSNEDWQNSSDPHYGIDIYAAMDAPLVAPTSGVIVAKGSSGYGNRVAIRDANGWHHWLIHMNSVASGLPAVGGSITAGTPIGKVGMTGGAGDVPHLHYHVTPGPETSTFWTTGIDFYPELRPTEVNVCDPVAPGGSIGIFETFTNNVGRFTRQPTYSGSTEGVAASSSTAWVTGWLRVILNDDATTTGNGIKNWKVRLLSADGLPGGNIATAKTGKLYFYLRTATAPAGSTVTIWVDDSDGTEQSSAKAVVAGNVWTKYEWNLASFGGVGAVGGNGVIDAATVTLDAIVVRAPNNSPSWTFYIDDIGN